MASRPVDQMPRTVGRWKDAEELRADRAAVAAQHRKRPNGHRRPRLTDEFLAEDAEVYRQYVPDGRPFESSCGALQLHARERPTCRA